MKLDTSLREEKINASTKYSKEPNQTVSRLKKDENVSISGLYKGNEVDKECGSSERP